VDVNASASAMATGFSAVVVRIRFPFLISS